MKHTIKQAKQMLGIMDTVITHVVEKTEATINWTGPKISREQWQEMLAFFIWTFKLNRSESQVRLFVNKDRWAIWAFPQKANTGMTAIELETEESVKQRGMFAEADGWHYFGTAHSHCSMGAFQSGTDSANEEKVDGVHFTIGKLDEKQYDIHTRMTLGGQQFSVDLAWFWDVGELGDQLPENMHHMLARHQMTRKIPDDAKFPEQWKENYIEVKPPPIEIRTPHRDWSRDEEDEEFRGCKVAQWKFNKIKKAMEEFEGCLEIRNVDTKVIPWWEVVNEIATWDHSVVDLLECMGKADIVWEDVKAVAEFLEDKEAEKKEAEEAAEDAAEDAEQAGDIKGLHDQMETEGGTTKPSDEDVARFNDAEQQRRIKEEKILNAEIEREAMMRQFYGE